MFDAIAGRYDLLNHLLSAGLDRRWRKQAIETLHLNGRETVLDLCTGTADLAIAAMDAAQPARRVVAIDFSGAMLQIGKAKIGGAGASWSGDARATAGPAAPKQRAEPTAKAGAPARCIALIRGDATHIPLADASVDAVTIGFGIRNVEQPEVACREIVRVLRGGGKLVMLEFSLPRSPILRNCYLWYFRRILPLIGRAISKHPSAYTYLPESVETFPSPDEFAQQLHGAGFSSVNVVSLTFGIVYMFVAMKK